MQTIRKQGIFKTGTFHYDVLVMLNQYVNTVGDKINIQREQDVLAIRKIVMSIESTPLLRSTIDEYLEKLIMPRAWYTCFIGFKHYSRFRELLNKVVKYHSQEQVIERLKKELEAEKVSKNMMAERYAKNIKQLTEAYEAKVSQLQQQLLATEQKVNEICRHIFSGRGVSIEAQESKILPVIDQSDMIYELQGENEKLRQRMKRLEADVPEGRESTAMSKSKLSQVHPYRPNHNSGMVEMV